MLDENEEFSKLTSIKQCPICKRRLDEGYAIAQGDLNWDTKKHKLWVPLSVERLTKIPWTLRNLPALRCRQCKIVVFDYEREKVAASHK